MPWVVTSFPLPSDIFHCVNVLHFAHGNLWMEFSVVSTFVCYKSCCCICISCFCWCLFASPEFVLTLEGNCCVLRCHTHFEYLSDCFLMWLIHFPFHQPCVRAPRSSHSDQCPSLCLHIHPSGWEQVSAVVLVCIFPLTNVQHLSCACRPFAFCLWRNVCSYFLAFI